MEPLTNLKAILHSKRANVYYLDKCRVMQKGGRVLFLVEDGDTKNYWNIPIANTTCILLGTGTSITQAAVRMLVSAGVLIGFSGGGGTPLLAASEVEWLSPQSEYRPTEYIQGWMSFWFDAKKRLWAAKTFQKRRLEYLCGVWAKDADLRNEGFLIEDSFLEKALNTHVQKIDRCITVNELLTNEARLTKKLYQIAAQTTLKKEFVRVHDSNDKTNTFLNHGNYLAYGLAATTLWTLGIPHGFAVMHGKTRRGALVFDVADLVKDALVLPWAFICAKQGVKEQDFRQQCLQNFTQHKALNFMFEELKAIALKTDWVD